MDRLLTSALLLGAFAAGWVGLECATAWGASPATGPKAGESPGVNTADLEQRLRSVLRARRDSEFAFIDMVVAKVAANELPVSVVNGAFNYARSRKPYPFPYFEAALRRLAEQGGYELD